MLATSTSQKILSFGKELKFLRKKPFEIETSEQSRKSQ